MYNRYIRNDRGVYERIPVQDPPPSPEGGPPPPTWEEPFRQPPPPPPPGDGSRRQPPPKVGGFLQGILSRLHLDSIDAGDLILLLIIYLLFREGEDEELLIALGLLLIL